MWYKKILLAACAVSLVGTLQAETKPLGEITVTGTRESSDRAETPATVGSVNKETIVDTHPAHPSEIGNRIAGVHINMTGGEGHMTSIRQPISTSPLYLYLEDGIPTRSTGFFNHNALYEINLPQSGGIEINKGPGTSLYGSDAIGGVINVLTQPSPLQAEASINAELGDHGWRRLLVSGGNSWDANGVRADLNMTQTVGWRQATDYERQSGTLRWDRVLTSGASLKTVLATSNIDQQTAGSSRLLQSDYENNPTLNYTPISYRQVDALRLSSAYEKESSDTLLSITPYFRDNSMEMMPNWSFTFDPMIARSENQSFGMLLKYRLDFAPMRTRLIVGADIDHSPGSRLEHSIDATRVGTTYTSYTVGTKIYDYDVTFQGISPYVHVETSPTSRLRMTAGLRYDHIDYDYDNKMADGLLIVNPTSTSFPVRYNHPGDTSVSFSHLSPKLGMTYTLSQNLNGFVSYRHAFRAPSEGQLFRPGRATNTLNLKPVKVDSVEAGIRGKRDSGMRYELSIYTMSKKDDILTYQHPDTSREVMNGGETLHKGIEGSLDIPLPNTMSLAVSLSYAKHTYEDWRPNATTNYSGNEMESAPRVVANTRLDYRPGYLNGGRMELEWERLGSYWMDQANTHKYDGHDLLHVRASYLLGKEWEFYGRIMNLTDERYATNAAYVASGSRLEYAPGLPRTVYAGATYHF